MTPEQRLERARQAERALNDFLAPAIGAVEAEYAERLVEVAASADPRAPELMQRLATGIKVARTIRARIEALVTDGAVAKGDIELRDALDRMPASDRRLVQMAPRRV